jgi:prepilin-type N-terminal cleavage/methylation domain-containing protein
MSIRPAVNLEDSFSRDPKGIAQLRGFTLVEALIAMSITAMLMLAMGAAFSAAAGSVENNDRYFRGVQQTRVALDLIMGEIRRCQAITDSSHTNSITLTASASDPGNFAGANITFAFNSGTGQVTMSINGGTPIAVASNVTNAVFNYGPSNVLPTEVSLALTVQNGEDAVTISNSAAPRYMMTSTWN